MPITELNENQIRAVASLEWLLDADMEARRSGRTTALAIAIIRTACNNPGTAVGIWDHHDTTQRARELMYRAVRDLLADDPRIAYELNIRSLTVTNGRAGSPTLDWWPLGTTPPEHAEPVPFARLAPRRRQEKTPTEAKKMVSKWEYLGKI